MRVLDISVIESYTHVHSIYDTCVARQFLFTKKRILIVVK